MGKIEINRVTNANVYLDGSNMLGRAEEVTLPSIKQKMSDHMGLGMVGEIELPTGGIEKMESTFKWSSFYPEVMRKAGNMSRAVLLQVRASVDAYTGEGLTNQTALVISLGGIFKELPLGGYKKHEGSTFETKLVTHYVKLVADGEAIIEVDVMNNIYKVSDEDLLARFRRLIGG